jgi:hypothetical protein
VKEALFIIGVTLELAGILLVASPDVVPQGQRASRWIQATLPRVVARFRRLTGQPQPQRVTIGAAFETDQAMPITPVKSPGGDAPLEAHVGYLLQRDKELQTEIAEFRRALDQKQVDLRAAMEGLVTEALRAAHREYLPLRISGVVALLLGLVCITMSTFM